LNPPSSKNKTTTTKKKPLRLTSAKLNFQASPQGIVLQKASMHFQNWTTARYAGEEGKGKEVDSTLSGVFLLFPLQQKIITQPTHFPWISSYLP
jgi:hypothetical protein